MPPLSWQSHLEDRGFESLWFPEHSHIPLSRDSDFPQGGDLPKKYYDVMDPFVVAGAAAAVTTTLKVATGICLVPQRDPIQTAKQVASIDQVSGGRFLFGVGAGWNADEMANHGTDFKKRNAVMKERIAAMREIWTQTKPEYHGEHVNFGPMMTWPKPVQSTTSARPGWWRPALWRTPGTRLWRCLAAACAPADLPPARHACLSSARWRKRQAARLPISPFGVEHDPAEWPAYQDAGIERIVISIDSEPSDITACLSSTRWQQGFQRLQADAH